MEVLNSLWSCCSVTEQSPLFESVGSSDAKVVEEFGLWETELKKTALKSPRNCCGVLLFQSLSTML